MNMPAFTAEASLYKTSGQYRTARQVIKLPARAIYATAAMEEEEWVPPPGEVVNIVGVAPFPWGPIPWRWGPGGWSGGGGGPAPVDEPGGPGGKGGGSGSGGDGGGKDEYRLKYCTREQFQSRPALGCLARNKTDPTITRGTAQPYYVSCNKEGGMACCQDSRKGGRLVKNCRPI